MKIRGGITLENEFYYIDEEYFNEDHNTSSYYPLDDLIFKSSEEAEEYLKNYFTKNNFHSISKESFEEGDHCFIITDGSFTEKYRGEGCTKFFYIKKLTLYK